MNCVERFLSLVASVFCSCTSCVVIQLQHRTAMPQLSTVMCSTKSIDALVSIKAPIVVKWHKYWSPVGARPRIIVLKNSPRTLWSIWVKVVPPEEQLDFPGKSYLCTSAIGTQCDMPRGLKHGGRMLSFWTWRPTRMFEYLIILSMAASHSSAMTTLPHRWSFTDQMRTWYLFDYKRAMWKIGIGTY